MRSSVDMSAQLQVLDDDDGRFGAEGLDGRLEQAVALARAKKLPDAWIEVRCEVDERTERTRGRQRVARPPEHPTTLIRPCAPGPHQCRFPHTSLAVDEHKAT